MSTKVARWESILQSAEDVFTAPSFRLFCQLMGAWVVVTARHTICQMVGVMDASTRGAHDAYHRFVRCSAWSLNSCLASLCLQLVRFVGTERLTLYIDDTLLHRNGPKVNGAGVWRDAVRSTARHVVYARGLNLVVVCVRVDPPWGGMPLSLPIAIRLHHKGGMTMSELAVDMLRELAEALPDHSFVVCADGAYATVAGAYVERTTVVSRMRRDAALYGPAPAKTGKRGRPRAKGERLATPTRFSKQLKRSSFKKKDCEHRGKQAPKLLWSKDVLWYRVNPKTMVRLVIVRDPLGHEPDDYFFTTDLTMDGAEVVSVYSGRWSIEICYRDVKQVLRGHQPQSWADDGPERAAGLSFWLYSAVWLWYLRECGDRPRFKLTEWFPYKTTASFTDALAELRRTLWRQRISPASGGAPLDAQTVKVMVEALAAAA